MLTGNNGILTQANKAKDETEQGTLEEVRLKVNERETDKYIGGERSLEEYLKEIEGASVEKLIEDAYLVKRGEAEVTVYEDGDIEKGKVEIWDGESTEVPEIKEFNWNIYNGAQLKFLADFVNNGNKLTEEQKVQIAEEGYQESDIVLNENTTVNLMNNIDLGARQENGELTSGVQWKPIGKTLDNCLKANFEGNNYTIKGVYVNEKTDYSGIFGVSATVKNLTVKDGYIEESGYTGGIIGMVNSGDVENCHNENTSVILKDNNWVVGGVVGVLNSGVNAIKCSNTGKVNANESPGDANYCGGVIGYAVESTLIKECYNEGEIAGEAGYIGGIVGGCYDSIENCYNTGKVKGKIERIGGIVGNMGDNNGSYVCSNCYNTGDIIGGKGIGGIAGVIINTTIDNCKNSGKVESESECAGGIIGVIGYPSTGNAMNNIKNCTNEGTIGVSGKGKNIGGIIGFIEIRNNNSGTIENNYNKGKVIGKTSIGGIVGESANTFTITKCYSKGEVEGESQIGAVIGVQKGSTDNLSSLYYLNTIGVKGINGKDVADKVMGVEDDINSYEEFIGWIENK